MSPSQAPVFNQLTYIDRLEKSGIEEKQARAFAEALDLAFHEGVAKVSDIQELTSEIQSVRTDLHTVKADLQNEIQTVRTDLHTVKADLQTVKIELHAKIDISNAELRAEIVRSQWKMIVIIGVMLAIANGVSHFLA